MGYGKIQMEPLQPCYFGFAHQPELVTPYLTKILVDDVIRRQTQFIGPDSHCHIWVCSMQRTAFLFSFLPFECISEMHLYDLRNDMYTHLQGLSFAFYDDNRIGELMSRMTGIGRHTMFVVGGLSILLENAIYFTGTTIMLFLLTQNWLLLPGNIALYCMGGC